MDNLLFNIERNIQSYELLFDIGTVKKVKSYTVDVQMGQKAIFHRDCYVIGKALPDLEQVGIVVYVGNAKVPCFISEKINAVNTSAYHVTNEGKNEDTFVGGFDFKIYATNPDHIRLVRQYYTEIVVGTQSLSEQDKVVWCDKHIQSKSGGKSPLTYSMFNTAYGVTGVNPYVLMAECRGDSAFGTAGLAVPTLNPGNVGNNDAGQRWYFATWQDGVNAVGIFLNGKTGQSNYPGLIKVTR